MNFRLVSICYFFLRVIFVLQLQYSFSCHIVLKQAAKKTLWFQVLTSAVKLFLVTDEPLNDSWLALLLLTDSYV